MKAISIELCVSKGYRHVPIVEKAAAEVLGHAARRKPQRWRSMSRTRFAATLALGVLLGAALFGGVMLTWNALHSQSPAVPVPQAQGGS